MDLIDGISIAETTDDATGISTKTVIDWKTQSKNADLKPNYFRDEKGNVIKKQMIMKPGIICPNSILSVTMDKKFMQVMLSQDYQKLQKQKI